MCVPNNAGNNIRHPRWHAQRPLPRCHPSPESNAWHPFKTTPVTEDASNNTNICTLPGPAPTATALSLGNSPGRSLLAPSRLLAHCCGPLAKDIGGMSHLPPCCGCLIPALLVWAHGNGAGWALRVQSPSLGQHLDNQPYEAMVCPRIDQYMHISPSPVGVYVETPHSVRQEP